MRLLGFGSDGDIRLSKNFIVSVPAYAILSYTWEAGEDEVALDDIRSGGVKSKAGYNKNLFCDEEARKDELQYFWGGYKLHLQ